LKKKNSILRHYWLHSPREIRLAHHISNGGRFVPVLGLLL
jgi:hypothetical protein